MSSMKGLDRAGRLPRLEPDAAPRPGWPRRAASVLRIAGLRRAVGGCCCSLGGFALFANHVSELATPDESRAAPTPSSC